MQGCDASVLLDESASGPSEKNASANQFLRKEAYKIIEDLRERVHKKCGRVVSCADITALAARDSVVLVNAMNLPLFSYFIIQRKLNVV
jgi:peroxidase